MKDHYSEDEICELLDRAEKFGFDLESNELEHLTIRELEILVTRIQ